MKINISFFGSNYVFKFNKYKKPTLSVSGYTSRCDDNKHVLFLDYDNVSPEIVFADLQNLSEDCTHFFIFATNEEKDELGTYGNYHVVCTDKFYFTDIINLQSATHTDENHKKMVRRTRYRAWVLRLFEKGNRPKPKFIKFIKTQKEYEETEQSLAHIKLLSALSTEIKVILKYELMNLDDNTKIPITQYTTAYENKGVGKDDIWRSRRRGRTG